MKIRPGDGDPRHGTENGYGNLKCRCDDCTVAHRIHYRKVRAEHPEYRERNTAREQKERSVRGEMRVHGPSEPTFEQVAEALGWVTRQELVDKFGTSRQQIAHWHNSGRFPEFVTIRGKYLYPPTTERPQNLRGKSGRRRELIGPVLPSYIQIAEYNGFLTVKQVARHYGCSEYKVKTHLIPTLAITTHMLYDPAELPEELEIQTR